jgi:hypothetical protein
MMVVNSIHAECVFFFTVLNSKKRQSSATVYILHIYTRIMHVYIFSPISLTVTKMHKCSIAFLHRYLLHMYTLILYLNVFSLISPTIIYSIHVFYVNSELQLLNLFEFLKDRQLLFPLPIYLM